MMPFFRVLTFLLPLQSVLQSGIHNDCDLVQAAVCILLLLHLWLDNMYRVIFKYIQMDYSIFESVDSPCRDGTDIRPLAAAAAYCDLRGRIKGAAN